MKDKLQPHPSPPADLSKRTLPVASSSIFYRFNSSERDSSLHFDLSGKGRFDGPEQGYGILYAGEIYASFIESYGRTHGKIALTEKELRKRNLFQIESQRELIFADLTGPGLVQIGADSRLSSGGSYTVTRKWAKAIHNHPSIVDGIKYRSRHDPDRFCYGIFDRCQQELREMNLGNLIDYDERLLGEILDYYQYGYIPY